jgi:hypothetical protein
VVKVEDRTVSGDKALIAHLYDDSLLLEVTLTYTLFDGHSAIRKQASVRNTAKTGAPSATSGVLNCDWTQQAKSQRKVMPGREFRFGSSVLERRSRISRYAPWIYNSWEPFFRNVNEQNVLELVDDAGNMGFDMHFSDFTGRGWIGLNVPHGILTVGTRCSSMLN